jgi:cytochrome c oxidase subunit 1
MTATAPRLTPVATRSAARARVNRPAFELHYPHYVERFRAEAHVGGRPSPYEVAGQAAGKEQQPDDDPRSR